MHHNGVQSALLGSACSHSSGYPSKISGLPTSVAARYMESCATFCAHFDLFLSHGKDVVGNCHVGNMHGHCSVMPVSWLL